MSDLRILLLLRMMTMAQPIGCLLILEDPDFLDAWLRCFDASTRTKKLKGNKAKRRENKVMGLFLVTAGVEAIRKVLKMAHHLKLEELTFQKISQIILRNI